MPRNTLVVGQEPEFVNRLVRLIEGEREVRAALTGQSAILYMSQRPATTVVIDDDLQDFSGSDLAFHLKALAETQVPPKLCCIIALRSDILPEGDLKVPGFDYVLKKPDGYLKIDQLLNECDLDLVRKLSQM